MSGDTIAIIVAIVGTGIGTGTALGLLIVPGLREMRRDIANLRERMSRLEGVVETLRDTIAGRQKEA